MLYNKELRLSGEIEEYLRDQYPITPEKRDAIIENMLKQQVAIDFGQNNLSYRL